LCNGRHWLQAIDKSPVTVFMYLPRTFFTYSGGIFVAPDDCITNPTTLDNRHLMLAGAAHLVRSVQVIRCTPWHCTRRQAQVT
jgi:hypothetical protein